MDKNSFDTICKCILNSEKMTGFTTTDRDTENFCCFDNQKEFYEIIKKDQKILLKKYNNIENKQDFKILSSWLFEEDKITQKDINTISTDFIESVNNSEVKNKSNFKKSAKKNNDERNVSGLFFANRMATIFPEIKSEIQEEKEFYTSFRTVNFTRKIILPKINEQIEQKNTSILKKLGKVFNDLYENGSLDVRSVITMVILNNINMDVFREYISDDLKKASSYAIKYKNKKVKPEKIKTKKSFFAKALEYQNQ